MWGPGGGVRGVLGGEFLEACNLHVRVYTDGLRIIAARLLTVTLFIVLGYHLMFVTRLLTVELIIYWRDAD